MKKQIAALLMVCLIVTANAGVVAAGELAPFSATDEVRNEGTRLLAESKEFATTPFQVENGNLLLTLGVTGAVGLTYVFDREIRDWTQRNRSFGGDKAADVAVLAGDPYLHLGLAALVYSGGVMSDSARWKSTGEMLGEALILADGATLILKISTGRGRPAITDNKNDWRPFGFKSDYDSFPSMHTASSFAFASVMANTSGSVPVTVMSYGAAALVGFSRMSQNKHWASDVLLAAALGELAGRVAIWQHASSGSFVLAPTVLDGGGGAALTGHF